MMSRRPEVQATATRRLVSAKIRRCTAVASSLSSCTSRLRTFSMRWRTRGSSPD